MQAFHLILKCNKTHHTTIVLLTKAYIFQQITFTNTTYTTPR